MIDVAVVTRFGPNRMWELPIWLESLERLELPKDRTRIVLGDNTGSQEDRLRLFDALENGMWAEYVLLRDDDYRCDKPDARPEWHSWRQARLFSRLVRATDYAQDVISLDSDILAPTREELGGVTAYEKMKFSMKGDVAIVGTPARSRWSGHVSVYMVDTIEPWGKLSFCPVPPWGGVQYVAAFGTALTLWRGDLFRKYELRGEPNIHAECRVGLEWWTYKRIMEDGYRLLVDWDVRPRHYKNAEEYLVV